jgi:hypothetical protein
MFPRPLSRSKRRTLPFNANGGGLLACHTVWQMEVAQPESTSTTGSMFAGTEPMDGRHTSTDELEQEEPFGVSQIAPDLHPSSRQTWCLSDRVGSSGDA